MKLFELINILNRSDILLNESMSLSELRRRIIKNEMRLDPSEEDWYRDENNRNELIDTISRIVGPSSETELNRELKKFNTSDYTEKGRIVKPESLNTALNLEILRVKNRITDENDDLSSQYEKLKIKKDVEIYSVFTPQANIQLSHKILKNNQEATWCIASPTSAFQMWSEYNLWNAKYPCVFTVVKRGIVNGIRNPKYQIKCCPELTEQFAKGEYKIFDFVDEVRNAKQDENDLIDTSLYKVTGINVQTLENAMRKLMNTDKAYSFSKKYGADFAERFNKLESDEQMSSNERIQLLIDVCKTGLFVRYSKKAKNSEIPFFIDRLIEYKTLVPSLIDIYRHSCMDAAIGFDTKIFNKIFNFFIKNKNCSGSLLAYARELNYPGIDEIYAKIFNSILVNEPRLFNYIDAIDIKKEYLDRYLKVLRPEYVPGYLFSDIIRTHDLDPNQIESICKIFFEKGNTLRSLVKELIKHNTRYIPIICNIASKLKKIEREDIEFLYENVNVNEIKDIIVELGLKVPEDDVSVEDICRVAYETISEFYTHNHLRNSTIVFCRALLDNIGDVENIPKLSDIIRSDANGSSEESKLHAAIIKEYEKHKLDLDLIYKDCNTLNELAQGANPISERFSKLGKWRDYYDKHLDGYPITPYDLYRYNLYEAIAEKTY